MKDLILALKEMGNFKPIELYEPMNNEEREETDAIIKFLKFKKYVI